MKETPLLDRIYKEPLYQEVCRFVGYFGTTVRELQKKPELLSEAHGKTKAESTQAHLTTYEGQFTTGPRPRAKVELRSDVRCYCFQLLGPPPEQWDMFYRNADGSPTPQHAEKMAEQERIVGKPPNSKEPRKRKATVKK